MGMKYKATVYKAPLTDRKFKLIHVACHMAEMVLLRTASVL